MCHINDELGNTREFLRMKLLTETMPHTEPYYRRGTQGMCSSFLVLEGPNIYPMYFIKHYENIHCFQEKEM